MKTSQAELTPIAPPCRLERIIRDLVAARDFQRVFDILEQLVSDYAYAVHQPHARNGGLIGLAAAAIALGSVSIPVLPTTQHPPPGSDHLPVACLCPGGCFHARGEKAWLPIL